MQGYCVYANRLNAEDHPEHWQAVLDIGRRMRHLGPSLAAGHDVATVTLGTEVHARSIFFREIVHEGVHIYEWPG